MKMIVGNRYNWKGQKERLVYLGYTGNSGGYWHQFALVNDPEKVWCQVTDNDLHMLEETKAEEFNPQKDYSVLLTDDCYQYITKDIPPIKRIVVTAANRHVRTGLLLVGARHWSKAMTAQAKACQIKPLDMLDDEFEQGFIDQYDQFMSRKDAKRIAKQNGQPLIGEDWGDELFSENLH